MYKKKILFLIPTLGGGGAERVLVDLVNGMDKTKYDITIQTLFKAGVNASGLSNNVRLVEGRLKQFSGNVLLLKLFSPKFLYRFFIKFQYDVLISYLEGPTARIISGCPSSNVKKLSWIHTIHKNLKETYYSFRSKDEASICYQSFDKMIYVSRDVMENFSSYYPELKDNTVLYNTYDDAKIIRMASEPLCNVVLSNEINIVSVGRLVPLKGFDRLIEVHHRLKKNGIKNHVYILGTGVLENELKKLVKKNGDTDTVHFLGFYSNPYSVVSRCNVYVCSSHREGFSTAVTEALILGIPVVTTSVSGAYEQMGENNEFGIVTENSTDGLYNGLRQLLNSKEQLDYYTKKALIRGGFFSKKNSIKAVEKVIDSL